MSSETITDNWTICQDAIAASIRAFPLVRLAIRDGWRGPETSEQVEDFIEEFLDWVASKDYEVPEITEQLKGMFEAILSCISDEEDIHGLAKDVYRLLERCADGHLDEARALIELHQALDPAVIAQSKAAASEPVQDTPKPAAPEQPRSEPDEDGWVTVASKPKRGGRR